MTIEGVSERSGVAKTTIYRHWPSRSQLVFDAFRSLLEPDAARYVRRHEARPIKDTLIFLLNGLIRGLTDSPWAPTVSALVDAAERDPEMRQLIHDFLVERMAGAQAIIALAVKRGELAETVDPELAVDMLAGAGVLQTPGQPAASWWRSCRASDRSVPGRRHREAAMIRVEPEHGTVETDGLRLHYVDWGNRPAPSMLLLHGTASHARLWDRFAAALSDSYHVVALDQRGFGDSDSPPDYKTGYLSSAGRATSTPSSTNCTYRPSSWLASPQAPRP